MWASNNRAQSSVEWEIFSRSCSMVPEYQLMQQLSIKNEYLQRWLGCISMTAHARKYGRFTSRYGDSTNTSPHTATLGRVVYSGPMVVSITESQEPKGKGH